MFFELQSRSIFLMLYADTYSLGTITVLFACTSYKQVYLFTCRVTLYDFFSSADFFKLTSSKYSFRNTINVKLFWYCQSWSGSWLFVKVISRCQNSPLQRKSYILTGKRKLRSTKLMYFKFQKFNSYANINLLQRYKHTQKPTTSKDMQSIRNVILKFW